MLFTIEDMNADGDKVCVRWMYRAKAMNKPVGATGMDLIRIASGKIEEFWVNLNIWAE